MQTNRKGDRRKKMRQREAGFNPLKKKKINAELRSADSQNCSHCFVPLSHNSLPHTTPRSCLSAYFGLKKQSFSTASLWNQARFLVRGHKGSLGKAVRPRQLETVQDMCKEQGTGPASAAQVHSAHRTTYHYAGRRCRSLGMKYL